MWRWLEVVGGGLRLIECGQTPTSLWSYRLSPSYPVARTGLVLPPLSPPSRPPPHVLILPPLPPSPCPPPPPPRVVQVPPEHGNVLEVSYKLPGYLATGVAGELLVTFTPKANEDIETAIQMLADTGPFTIPIR